MKTLIGHTPKSIEQEFGIRYPEIYTDLYWEGMLKVPSLGSLQKNERPFHKCTPLLCLIDGFHILNFDEIYDQVCFSRLPYKSRPIRPDSKLVPFAETECGDFYCFDFMRKNGFDVPIVFVYGEIDATMVLGKNFQDFIFRMLLEDAEGVYEDCPAVLAQKKHRLNKMLESHSQYLCPKRAAILKRIFDRDWIDYSFQSPMGQKHYTRGLLTNIELGEILKSELGEIPKISSSVY